MTRCAIARAAGALALVAALGAAGCGRDGGDDRAVPDRTEVTVAAANVEPDEPMRCYLGAIVAAEAVDVAAETEGVIEDVRVRLGDRPARGSVLATLDTRDLEHQLAIERAHLRTVQAEKRKHEIAVDQSAEAHRRRLALSGVLSREAEEEASANLDTARLALEAADAELAASAARLGQLQARLERSVVRAPFDGDVEARYVDPGAWARPGTAIVRLLRADRRIVRFAVPPDKGRAWTVGDPVRVEVAQPATVLSGVIDQVAPTIDAASQMIFIEATLAVAPATSAIPLGSEARVSEAAAACWAPGAGLSSGRS